MRPGQLLEETALEAGPGLVVERRAAVGQGKVAACTWDPVGVRYRSYTGGATRRRELRNEKKKYGFQKGAYRLGLPFLRAFLIGNFISLMN